MPGDLANAGGLPKLMAELKSRGYDNAGLYDPAGVGGDRERGLASAHQSSSDKLARRTDVRERCPASSASWSAASSIPIR